MDPGRRGYWKRLEDSWLLHHPTLPSRGSALAHRASKLRKETPRVKPVEREPSPAVVDKAVEPERGQNSPEGEYEIMF